MRVRLALQLEDKASGAARWLFQINSFSLHVLFAEEASVRRNAAKGKDLRGEGSCGL